MRVIHWGKYSGKTTRLIELAAENDEGIVCATKKRADQIERIAASMCSLVEATVIDPKGQYGCE